MSANGYLVGPSAKIAQDDTLSGIACIDGENHDESANAEPAAHADN